MNEREVLARASELVESEVTLCTSAIEATTSGAVRAKVMPIYRRMDKALSASTGKVDCGPGCDYCCYYHVLVTGAEVFALAEHINAQPADRRKTLSDRVVETAKRVAPLSSVEYIQTNIPCAFLEDGRCTVYEARPSACRGFHSCDVKGCRAAFEDPTLNDPNAWDPERQAASIGYKNALLASQYKAGCDATSYEMHTALAEALTNRSSFKRWKAGKIAFPTVNDRVSIEEAVAGN